MEEILHFHLRSPPPIPSLRPTTKPVTVAVSLPLLGTPFRDKLLFLDSIGVSSTHPALVSAPLPHLKSTVSLLSSAGLTSSDLRRACSMCPEILTVPPSHLTDVLTFLLREASVQGSDLRKVLHRRPRLLVSDVASRLRPTLYFLQMLGIADVASHAHLLSCSVEEKLLPRIDFLVGVGFAPRDARAMLRKFPQIFCYSLKGNLEPKFDFFSIEMKRDLKELKRFPQFFSFSLDRRIRPRHRMCEEKGVVLLLPALLKPSDHNFNKRLEVCFASSPPLRISPLWRRTNQTNTNTNTNTKNNCLLAL